GPELDQICINNVADPWACGVDARDQLVSLIGKGRVRCEDVGADKNFSKWRIGVCTVDGSTISLNQQLVREGFAFEVEPAAKGRFKGEEADARDHTKGLWKGCFAAPQDFRRGEKTGLLSGAACRSDKDREIRAVLFPSEPTMPSGCTIKAKFAAR